MTNNKKDILIVDDETDIRGLIKAILEDEGYQVREAENSTKALAEIQKKLPDLLILDIWLQGSDKDGLEILELTKSTNKLLPVIMISGHGTIETAVSAIKKGAYDFIEKPFKSDRLLLMIARGLENAALKKENQSLKSQANKDDMLLIGTSQLLTQLKGQIEKIAPTNSRVLITGEGGTGKEVIAKTIHKLSQRKDYPFMVINCASLNPERLEEELFGIYKDTVLQKGMLELANGGTIFLDEISDMKLETQAKIIRVLQDNKIQPVGEKQNEIIVDVRFIASTSKDLTQSIEKGLFREDLFYRLNVVTLNMPPLRKRRDDIAPLVEYFLNYFSMQTGQPKRTLAEDAMLKLQNYNWPGNVRQLKNMMEWITIMTSTPDIKPLIHKADLPPELTNSSQKVDNNITTDYVFMPLREARELFEKQYLESQVSRFNGNISQTAEFIGMERSALHRKLKSLEIYQNDNQDREEKIKV